MDAYNVIMAMNNALIQNFVQPEKLEQINKIRQNCIAAGGSHKEQDMNARILICYRDNQPCMMQCMNQGVYK